MVPPGFDDDSAAGERLVRGFSVDPNRERSAVRAAGRPVAMEGVLRRDSSVEVQLEPVAVGAEVSGHRAASSARRE
jgi:hypothetical protein